MTGKTKKDLQTENSKLREELFNVKGKLKEVCEKKENLQEQLNLESTTQKHTFRCDNCEIDFERVGICLLSQPH